jgi:hypothetical protein
MDTPTTRSDADRAKLLAGIAAPAAAPAPVAPRNTEAERRTRITLYLVMVGAVLAVVGLIVGFTTGNIFVGILAGAALTSGVVALVGAVVVSALRPRA